METVKVNRLDWAAMAVVTVGALIQGLIGVSGFLNNDPGAWKIVNILFGSVPEAEYAIYSLIGLAGLYLVYFGYKVADKRESELEESEDE